MIAKTSACPCCRCAIKVSSDRCLRSWCDKPQGSGELRWGSGDMGLQIRAIMSRKNALFQAFSWIKIYSIGWYRSEIPLAYCGRKIEHAPGNIDKIVSPFWYKPALRLSILNK